MRTSQLKNSRPSTYTVQFFEPVNKFTIRDDKGHIYFYRYVPNKCRAIEVNIPDIGTYYPDTDAVFTRKPLSIAKEIYDIRLPNAERARDKDFFISHDDNLTVSPAIIYTHTGQIITGRKFKTLPAPMKIFVLLHETGHFKYATEKYCDLYACVEMVKMGYNPSSAMYCLTDQLRDTPKNDERIKYIYNTFVKYGIIKP